MNHHKSNSQLQVDGKMSEKDAGQVGKMQAAALIIFAVSSLVLAISALIWALK